MNNQDKQKEKTSDATAQNNDSDSSKEVNIQPSETDLSEKNRTGDPGRTPGKAEGSREVVEADLEEHQRS